MILDSEEQRQNLLSLISIVPVQGNLSQGVDKMITVILDLRDVVLNADVQTPGKTIDQEKIKR